MNLSVVVAVVLKCRIAITGEAVIMWGGGGKVHGKSLFSAQLLLLT